MFETTPFQKENIVRNYYLSKRGRTTWTRWQRESQGLESSKRLLPSLPSWTGGTHTLPSWGMSRHSLQVKHYCISYSNTVILLPHPNYTLQSDREEEVLPLQLLFQPPPLPEQCWSRLSPQRSRKCSRRQGCLFSSQLTVGRGGEVKNISPS